MDGSEVIGVDSFTDFYSREIKENNLRPSRSFDSFQFREADLTTLDLRALLADTDGIFHLAAQPGVRGSWGDSFSIYVKDNILATQRVFEAAAREKIRIVFASSSSVYGNAQAFPVREDAILRPISPYGVTKLSCETLAAAYADSIGCDVVALRYFTVYGPRQRPEMAFARICASLAHGSLFPLLGSGEQSRDFTYVADVVSATMLAMDASSPAAVYNVGGGTEASLNEIIDLCERLSGRSIDVAREGEATGDVRRTSASTDRIRELGWKPRFTLEAGLRAQLEAEGVPVRA